MLPLYNNNWLAIIAQCSDSLQSAGCTLPWWDTATQTIINASDECSADAYYSYNQRS